MYDVNKVVSSTSYTTETSELLATESKICCSPRRHNKPHRRAQPHPSSIARARSVRLSSRVVPTDESGAPFALEEEGSICLWA